MRNRSLQFFSGAPGIVRVTAADRELVYSLVLPEVSEAKWEPPAGVRRGIPADAAGLRRSGGSVASAGLPGRRWTADRLGAATAASAAPRRAGAALSRDGDSSQAPVSEGCRSGCSASSALPEGGAHDLRARLGSAARLASGRCGSSGNGANPRAAIALVLKAAGLAAVLIALAEPRLTVHEPKVAAAILVDTSASVTPQDLARASDLATQIEAARGRRWTRVIPFARSARNTAPEERGKAWSLKYTAGDGGHATNLEAALRDAAASLPAGLVPRIVLISDGNENLGSVVRAAWQARQLGIPIDTFSLGGRPKPNLRLESMSLPVAGFQRRAAFRSTSRSALRGARRAAGRDHRRRQDARIEPRRRSSRASIISACTPASAPSAPWTWPARSPLPELGEARFEQAVTLRRPQVLLHHAGSRRAPKSICMQTLEANQFEVRRSTNGPPEDLERLPVADLQQLGPGIALARAEDHGRGVRQAGRRDCSGSAATATSTSRARRRKIRSSARCPPSSLRRALRRAPAWCSSSTSRRPWKARRWSWRAWRRSAWWRICGPIDHGGRADLRQLVSVDGADTPRDGPLHDQAPDRRASRPTAARRSRRRSPKRTAGSCPPTPSTSTSCC